MEHKVKVGNVSGNTAWDTMQKNIIIGMWRTKPLAYV